MRRTGRFRTTLSSKVAVALSGLGLAGFVVFHMLGNLQVFEGPGAYNKYAAFLREMPMVLWTVRLGLLTVAVVHIVRAIQLALRNRRARPVAYTVRAYRVASLASRTMALTGSLLLLFIVFHLLHLSADLVDSSFHDHVDERGHADVFSKVIHAFHNPLYVLLYCAGQLVLGMHLSHAISGSLQTLGFEHAVRNRVFKAVGPSVALFVMLGNLVIILAVFFGLVRT